MSLRRLASYIAAALVVLLGLALIAVLRRRRINKKYFMSRWLELMGSCASRKDWPVAVKKADGLLEEALKKKRFKGKTTGEKLVSAQRSLTNNESVWFGHKLSQRIEGVDVRKLRKQDILEALQGFRQALRDLGALEVPKDD
jgi:hypothetical protein